MHTELIITLVWKQYVLYVSSYAVLINWRRAKSYYSAMNRLQYPQEYLK